MTLLNRVGRLARITLLNLGVFGILLALLEGAAHGLLLADGALDPEPPVAERAHTTYDPLLGWVNVPNVHLPDHYGAGVPLTTNAQGFRGTRDVDADSPTETRRIVCSGDSFTLGFGVSDSETWCALLGEPSSGVETVNMGQGGYGVDQAHLWYSRDATFGHDILLFAFIGEDFTRMLAPRFLNYDKPMLALDADSVVATNVPVPRDSFDRSGRVGRWGRALTQLHMLEVVNRVAAKLGMTETRSEDGGGTDVTDPTPEQDATVRAMMATLVRTARARGATPIAVYLPTEGDYGRSDFDAWKNIVRSEAERNDFPFWDLTATLNDVDPVEYRTLFIQDGTLPYANGHYSVAGNRWAASKLHGRLTGIDLLPTRDR